MGIEGRERSIHLAQGATDVCMQIVGALVTDVIGGAEDGSAVMLIGFCSLLTGNI